MRVVKVVEVENGWTVQTSFGEDYASFPNRMFVFNRLVDLLAHVGCRLDGDEVYDAEEASGARNTRRLIELDAKLDRIIHNQAASQDREIRMGKSIDDLKAEVAVVKTDFADAVAAIQAEKASIDDLTAKLVALTGDGSDVVSAADVQAITADLQTSSANLEAVLAAAAASAATPVAVPVTGTVDQPLATVVPIGGAGVTLAPDAAALGAVAVAPSGGQIPTEAAVVTPAGTVAPPAGEPGSGGSTAQVVVDHGDGVSVSGPDGVK